MQRWGRFIARHRRFVVALGGLCLVLSITGIALGGQPQNSNSFDFESGRAYSLMSRQLPSGAVTVTLVAREASRTVQDPAFHADLDSAVASLRQDRRVTLVETPYDATSVSAQSLVSNDRHMALAIVSLNLTFNEARRQFGELRSEVHPPPAMTVTATGDAAVAYDFDSLLAADVEKAEIGSSLVALVLLVIVFGTGVAAMVCLGVGLLAVTGGVAAALSLAHVTDVSTYAVNIVTLIGLGIAIDYSLFIVSRFREELAAGRDVEDAVAVAMGTAGRAVAFSGVTVAIGLAAMLFYRGTILVSMGICGAMVVAISVLFALTFLPALLAVLGSRVNRLAVPVLQPRPVGQGLWHRIAVAVMRRPVVILVPTVLLLLAAGSPFLRIHLASTDVTQLPPDAESRRGAELLSTAFPGQGTNLVSVVVDFDHASPLSPSNVATAYALSRRFAAMPGVAAVHSYVTDAGLTLAGYQALYGGPRSALTGPLAQQVSQTVGRSIAVLGIEGNALPASDAAHALVRAIRAHDGAPGAQVLVTGDTAFDIDFVAYIVHQTPAAVVFAMLTTMLVLFFLLRSVVLPVKAVLMNLLSLSAAFGGMVWVFQDGHLASALNFSAGPIDPTLPVLLFCVVFGLSMDYEVFLLTRMQEAWHRSHDNRVAVAEGLERSGRLVTGAAAIMVTVFIAFGLARVVTIKATGLGMAVAVIADATLVRALVVPALMRLLGRANWWAPRWASRLPAPPA